MTISVHNFNLARTLLVRAGSQSASKCHAKHATDSCPDAHGLSLLREARDEFNKLPPVQRDLGRAVVVNAAAQMRIQNW
jgi:hypothetical protein